MPEMSLKQIAQKIDINARGGVSDFVQTAVRHNHSASAAARFIGITPASAHTLLGKRRHPEANAARAQAWRDGIKRKAKRAGKLTLPAKRRSA